MTPFLKPQHSSPTVKQPASFAALGGRITGWTSNLLATAVVAVLALGIGRQLIAWYRVDPGESPTGSSNASAGAFDFSGADGRPLELEFGSLDFQLRRRVVLGSWDDAQKALIADCRERLADRPLPPSEAEGRLLAQCAKLSPVFESEGAAIYSAPEGAPMVVATGVLQQGQTGDDRRHAAGEATAGSLGAAARGVVAWGLATPAGPGEWHLYVAHASPAASEALGASEARASSDARRVPRHESAKHNSATQGPTSQGLAPQSAAPQDRSAVGSVARLAPLPPGARITLAVSSAGGGLAAIAGAGSPAAWTSFYGTEMRARGWQASGAWLSDERGAWRARFERVESGELATIDIQIMPDGQGNLMGFLSAAGVAGKNSSASP